MPPKKKIQKKVQKKTKRKKNTRGRKPYIKLKQLDQIYKIINKVQIGKELIYVYFIDNAFNATAENILKDTEIEYEKIEQKNKILFKIIPNMNVDPMKDVFVEAFNDEIIEEGELF